MKPSNQLIMSAAIAGLIAGGVSMTAATPAFAKDKKVSCYNSCQGKGACKTDKHACKGQNACAGQGKVQKLSTQACAKMGGTTTMPEMKPDMKSEEKKEGT